MTDGLLTVIAIAVTVMAVIQVAAIVFALRAARQVGEAVGRLERDIRPIIANLQTSSTDLAKTTALARLQVERADKLVLGLTQRVDDTVANVQNRLLSPLRDGAAVISGIKTAFEVFRDLKRRPRRSQPVPPAEGDDAMFIG